ncbi:hypothetical protein DPMN_045511 [Dreissena polymorpha]|uniref:Uncharacterized protein n=1 Tax=Dreissena polymorpha TaxID=45954 RepID=A0A9D4D4H7_DREPO|nr:hypothetical protein DPMN_045511 [Dreissena polymorpha]
MTAWIGMVFPFSAAHFISARKTSSISFVSASVTKVFRANGHIALNDGLVQMSSNSEVGGIMSETSRDYLASERMVSKSFCGNRQDTVLYIKYIWKKSTGSSPRKRTGERLYKPTAFDAIELK